MVRLPGAALVGRALELEQLRECYRRVDGGAGALVLLDGEAGSGKTRLLAEIAKAPFLPRGYTAVVAGALDYVRAPYGPIRDLLASLDRRFPKVLGGNATLAAALRPVVDFKPLDDAQNDPALQRRVLDAVVSVLRSYAAVAPLLLAIEDVHWIDRASADVLVHVSRSITEMRAMLLVSFRATEAGEDERARYLVGQLARTASVALCLRPLSRSDAMLLIDDAAPAGLPMSVRRQISELADGNPLLLLEFTKLAVENPDTLHGALPITLKALVADRLAAFDAVDIDILRVAAEMGAFDPGALAQIAGVQADRAIATLRKARAASIVEEQRSRQTPFVFRHALIRHAITDDLLAIERADLHRRIGAHLEGRAGDDVAMDSRLAHHFWHAGDWEKARRYSETAAAQAMQLYAFSDAVQLFQRAIGDRALDLQTFALNRQLADAYALAQRSEDAVRLTEQLFTFAVENDLGAAIGEVGFELSRRRYRAFDDEGSIEAIRQALACIDAAAHPAIVFNLLSTLAWYYSHFRRVEEGRDALACAQALVAHGDDEAKIRYYEASAQLQVHGDGAPSYRSDLENALTIAQSCSPALLTARLINAIGLAMASNMDDVEYAVELCGRLERAAKESPPSIAAHSLAAAAWPLYLYGDLRRAYAALQPAGALVEEAAEITFFFARTAIPLALHLDDPLLLRRAARPRLLENAFASQAPNVFGPIAAAVASHLRSEKRMDEARALLTRAIERLPHAANNIPLFIEAARAGLTPLLAQRIGLLEQVAAQSRSAQAAVHLCSAYALRGDEQRAHAQRAAALFTDIDWPLYAAEALELSGDRATALETYRACGAVSGVRRLERKDAAQSRDGLSKREWEVAEMVAAGKSNRVIAAELVLSERTVENHVASLFTKLGAHSRSEVAAHIARSQAGE